MKEESPSAQDEGQKPEEPVVTEKKLQEV